MRSKRVELVEDLGIQSRLIYTPHPVEAAVFYVISGCLLNCYHFITASNMRQKGGNTYRSHCDVTVPFTRLSLQEI